MNIRRGQKFPTYKSETLRNNIVFDAEDQNSKPIDQNRWLNKPKNNFARKNDRKCDCNINTIDYSHAIKHSRRTRYARWFVWKKTGIWNLKKILQIYTNRKLIKETIDTNVLKTLRPYSDKNGITKPEFEVYDNQIKVILPKNLYMWKDQGAERNVIEHK